MVETIPYRGPLMAHNPKMHTPPTGQSLMALNKRSTMNARYKNEHIIYNGIDIPKSSKSGPDYFCRSNASSFARSGIATGGKHYYRDPLSGTWYKNEHDRRRELHPSKSVLAYRYSESKEEKGDGAKTFTIWAAPCPPGHFFTEPIEKPQKPTQFGF